MLIPPLRTELSKVNVFYHGWNKLRNDTKGNIPRISQGYPVHFAGRKLLCIQCHQNSGVGDKVAPMVKDAFGVPMCKLQTCNRQAYSIGGPRVARGQLGEPFFDFSSPQTIWALLHFFSKFFIHAWERLHTMSLHKMFQRFYFYSKHVLYKFVFVNW